ncbi:MAG: hypothetical protein ACPLKS_04835, partial [Caldisericum exile]
RDENQKMNENRHLFENQNKTENRMETENQEGNENRFFNESQQHLYELKALLRKFDDFQNARKRTQNLIRSLERKYAPESKQLKDKLEHELLKPSLEGYEGLTDMEKKVKKQIEELAKETRLWNEWLKDVKGIGPYTCGYIVGTLEPYWARLKVKYFEKGTSTPKEKQLYPFKSRSSLEKFCGYAVGGKYGEGNYAVSKRNYKKGDPMGNPKLKSFFWRVTGNLIMANGVYKRLFDEIYEECKKKIYPEYLKRRFNVTTREEVKKLHPNMYIPTAYELAYRKLTKIFISHIWEEFQRMYKLPITRPQHRPAVELKDEEWIRPLRDENQEFIENHLLIENHTESENHKIVENHIKFENHDSFENRKKNKKGGERNK